MLVRKTLPTNEEALARDSSVLLASSPPLHPDFIPHFPFHAPLMGAVSSLIRSLSVFFPIATCPGGLWTACRAVLLPLDREEKPPALPTLPQSIILGIEEIGYSGEAGYSPFRDEPSVNANPGVSQGAWWVEDIGDGHTVHPSVSGS